MRACVHIFKYNPNDISPIFGEDNGTVREVRCRRRDIPVGTLGSCNNGSHIRPNQILVPDLTSSHRLCHCRGHKRVLCFQLLAEASSCPGSYPPLIAQNKDQSPTKMTLEIAQLTLTSLMGFTFGSLPNPIGWTKSPSLY